MDKYVEIFIAALGLTSTEKEIRDFWKQEAKNRSMLGLQQNNDEYNKMVDACSTRIEKLKGN